MTREAFRLGRLVVVYGLEYAEEWMWAYAPWLPSRLIELGSAVVSCAISWWLLGEAWSWGWFFATWGLVVVFSGITTRVWRRVRPRRGLGSDA